MKPGTPILVCFFAAYFLAACAQDDGPRIRAFDPTQSTLKPPETLQVSRQKNNPNAHIVQAGESLYVISRRYGVPLRALIERNGLTPPFTLRPGQSVIVPASRTHIVQSGDTVYGISRRYGVDMSALVARNRINAPYTIRVGQKLEIPGTIQQARVQAGASRTAANRTQRGQQKQISQRPNSEPPAAQAPAPPSELLDEPLDAPQSIPQQSPQPQQVDNVARATPETRSNAVRAPRRTLEFRMTASGYPRPVLRPDWLQPEVRLATNRPIPTPAPRASSAFLWPVNGRVISGFGPKAGGLHNDGINIAAPRGVPVLAAENGVVVYSGSELQGFGQMILIKHADGYLTAYGHNSKTLVQRGDTVRRGQAIAQVGSTGNVDRPQLHFEIRKGRKAIDPRTRLAT